MAVGLTVDSDAFHRTSRWVEWLCRLVLGQGGDGGKEERSVARIPPPVNGLVVARLVVTTRHLFVERGGEGIFRAQRRFAP